MTNYWLSWYCKKDDYGKFELTWPWWVSGARDFDESLTICAAVQAESTDQAMKIIENCYDIPTSLEWRFCERKSQDWSPFCDRFSKHEWMQWPNLINNKS